MASTFTISIDTGGTFTDAFIADSEGTDWSVKVPTTPHDLTVCFSDAVDESAAAVGLSRDDLLRRTAIIRFSSTIATNTALTLSGPKLGLLVTVGEERSLYGAGDERLFQFVPPDMVTGIAERMSPDGELELAPDADEVNRVVRNLLERGARLLVVSLRNSTANPANETAVWRIITESYPRHYLGAVPTILSTNVSAVADDAARTAAAVVNAYVHKRLATSLYKAEDDLRSSRLRHPLLVVTADGSVTRVSKTRALSTYQSGPAAGVHAGSLLCRTYGIEAALTADVGGTSTDFGLVVGGEPVTCRRVDVGGLEVPQSSVELLSIALGGGSVVTVADGSVRVGPESAGAAPGPACFGMGGTDPTPTDAWLVLGYLDPANYLGGRRVLFPELAAEALERTVGATLGLSAEHAALEVKEAAEQAAVRGMDEMLGRAAVRTALGDRSLGEVALVCYGGAGGCLLPSVARRMGLGHVYLSKLSPVFSAFGVSSFDVEHRYEVRARVSEAANGALDRLVDAARRDARGEGFAPADARYAVGVLDEAGTVLVGEVALEEVAAALAALDLPERARVMVSLRATCEAPKPGLPREEEASAPAATAESGRRTILLPEGRTEVPVYARTALRAGHVLAGPCLIESAGSTYLIPDDVTCTIDRFGTAFVA